MPQPEKLGATYKLFGETCRKCHYITRSNQCAWFEYPHIAQEIRDAKDHVKQGVLACPYYKKKTSVNQNLLFRTGVNSKRQEGTEYEDESGNDDDLLDL